MMRCSRLAAVLLVVAALAGCATPPPYVATPDEDEEPVVVEPPSPPLIEYPPIEPVEPPIVAPEATPAPASPPAEAPPAVPPAATPAPEIPPETLELLALLADLQRYGTLQPEDLRRELAASTQAFTRQRTDANRVRLAVLFTLVKNSPQDDQRALQLLENVAKSNPGSAPVKQVAAVVQAQIVERQRAVRDEQQKADVAIKKLEALRAMESSLLRDRIRSGGTGGGGGGGGGAGSAGGGGGGGGSSGGR
jgi:uncharacterized membrane protein YgcG